MSNDADAIDYEQRMKNLQCQKLEAEVRQINQSWWQRPSYVGSLAPIVIAVAGVVAAWATGFFDQQRKILSNQIATLETQKQNLDEQMLKAIDVRDNAIEDTKKARRLINEVYLSVKLWNFNATYAIEMATWNPESDDLEVLKEHVGTLDDKKLRERFSNLFEDFQIGRKTMGYVKKKNDAVKNFLIKMPASSKVKKLVPNPNEMLTDLETGQQYTVSEISEILDEDE